MRDIVLASGSPYRRDLLSRLGIPFRISPPSLDETPFQKSIPCPKELAIHLAKLKAREVKNKFPESLIIASDQTLSLEGSLFNKPQTPIRAKEQLQSLSGKTHQLTTAVCLLSPDTSIEFFEISELTMRSLSSQKIESYIQKERPLDCVGAYKIEGNGITLFESIKTLDFTSVIGLPLIALTTHLQKLGHHL